MTALRDRLGYPMLARSVSQTYRRSSSPGDLGRVSGAFVLPPNTRPSGAGLVDEEYRMTVDSSPVKFTPALPGQPVPEIRTIGGDRPVFRAQLPDGRIVWLVSGYANVRQVITDQRFSRAMAVAPGQAQPGFEMFAAGSINGMDPPEHTRLRKLVASAFTRRRAEALRPRVASIVNRLIDAMLDWPQPVDLAAGFSLPLPAQVICEMLGVPAADTGQFHAWSDTVMGDWQRDSDEIMTALAELYGYFGRLIEIKRAQPADDLVSALIAARDDTDRLSEQELTVMCCTLLIGGHETTANQINLSLLLLFDHPGQVAKLRADPGLIPGAVEELLRYARLGGLAPARVASEDVAIGGVTIPAGEQVIPLFATANRDPSVFADPDRFDVTRDAASHLSFGAGVHHCLGAQLARVELQEAFRGLIGRLPGLRLAVPASELEFKPGMAIHSLRELPVLWGEP
jgi:cytochrome P450